MTMSNPDVRFTFNRDIRQARPRQGVWLPAYSFAPEILEPRRRQLRVPYRVLNVAVAKVSLKRPRVVPLVGQRVAAGVPQHVLLVFFHSTHPRKDEFSENRLGQFIGTRLPIRPEYLL
jgi:hypothetical protein